MSTVEITHITFNLHRKPLFVCIVTEMFTLEAFDCGRVEFPVLVIEVADCIMKEKESELKLITLDYRYQVLLFI